MRSYAVAAQFSVCILACEFPFDTSPCGVPLHLPRFPAMEVPLWRIVGRLIAGTASASIQTLPGRWGLRAAINFGWPASTTSGWPPERTLAAKLGVGPLQMAIDKRGTPAGLIYHSDRGDYAKFLGDLNIQISMSAKAESFMKTLQHEEGYRVEYLHMADAGRGIRRFLERTYNRNCLHSTLSHKLPEEFDCSPAALKDPA